MNPSSWSVAVNEGFSAREENAMSILQMLCWSRVAILDENRIPPRTSMPCGLRWPVASTSSPPPDNAPC